MSFRSPFILLRNVFAALLHVWNRLLYTLARWLRKDIATYVTVELQQDYDFGPTGGVAGWFQQDLSWMELREHLLALRDSPDVDGVIVSTDGVDLGMGRAASIRDLLDEIRDADKHVVAFLEGATTAEYMMATAADDILMPPVDSMFTFGPRFDQTFAKEALEAWDVEPQFIHLGDFKTATHPAIHESMTVPQQEMMQQLYDRLTGELTGRIARRRGLDADVAGRALFGGAPQDATAAVRSDLIDHGIFYDRIRPWLMCGDSIPAIARHDELFDPEKQDDDGDADELSAGEDAPAPTGINDVDFLNLEESPAIMRPEFNWWRVVSSAPKIGVLNLSGPIMEDSDGLPIQQQAIIDPDDVVPAVQRLRDDPHVEGVIAHINSPGGSATASDVIWQSLVDLAEIKPLAAYCTDVAASGGYYLASAADRIVCHSTTMTGSIGVVLGKVSADELPDRLGINVESIHEYEPDTFTSPVHPLSPDMMDRLNEEGRAFYRRFLERVGQSRDLARRRLHRYARGRVYFGADAHHRGLVDELGAFDDAYDWILERTDLTKETAQLQFVEHRNRGIGDVAGLPGLTQQALQYWQSDTDLVSHVLDRLSPDNGSTPMPSPELTAAMLQREHLLALAPLSIDWK